jgi:hypothetical protein
LTEADPPQGPRLGAFLSERPESQVQASIVPKIAASPWAPAVFEVWEKGDVSKPVKNAIKKARENGNVPV